MRINNADPVLPTLTIQIPNTLPSDQYERYPSGRNCSEPLTEEKNWAMVRWQVQIDAIRLAARKDEAEEELAILSA